MKYLRDSISITIDHICTKNRTIFATCYWFLAFDQSGLTAAVWQNIFHILLRIGNKMMSSTKLNTINKNMVLRSIINCNNCFEKFDCLIFFSKNQLKYISLKHDATKTIKFVDMIANVWCWIWIHFGKTIKWLIWGKNQNVKKMFQIIVISLY